MKQLYKGRLEVVCGSMFSGKTEELLRRLKRAEYAKKNVLTLKHHLDNRASYTCIASHNGQKREAFPMGGSTARINKILELAQDDVDVLGIDEIQFFPKNIVDVVKELIDMGKTIIVSGLDMDFRGEPFGIMPTLLALADNITKLKAICVICGKEAHNTQRIINGMPAKYDDPIILVGASECYEARCRDCFVMKKDPMKVHTPQTQTIAQI
ncbi:thymidine kinase [Candidatus Babeliales bacterium]|nr:thymidine kinase [Candidatus Babeliales bacterium]